MIRLKVGNGSDSKPKITVTHHATGKELCHVFPMYRTRGTGRWAGKTHGTLYYTPEDRQHLLNEARQYAEGFRAGYEYARSLLTRVDDNQPVVEYQADEPYAVRRHEESLRYAKENTSS